MCIYKFLFFILVIFIKTGNVLSQDNIFNVNNIEIFNKSGSSNEDLTNSAIKSGYNKLLKKILLSEDYTKLSDLNFSKIKELVSYYQIATTDENDKENIVNFNIQFDKNKFHKLFYNRNLLYSEIQEKELYLLPILVKDDQIFIYNDNYFYTNWNKVYESDLIDFILPIETIEVIQNLNLNKNNLYEIDLKEIFQEYSGKNLALILIEDINPSQKKIYIQTLISDKNIYRNIKIKQSNLNNVNYSREIVKKISEELINIIKSQNLIDIRTPSFLNTKFATNNLNNLVDLKERLSNIDAIDGIFVQEFNNRYILLKIKYLGKLDRIIKKLKEQNILLRFSDDQWSFKII